MLHVLFAQAGFVLPLHSPARHGQATGMRVTLVGCADGKISSRTSTDHVTDITSAAASIKQLLAEDVQAIAAATGCACLNCVGSGHYGSVFLATRNDGNAPVAIKVAPHPSPTLTVEQEVLRVMHGQAGFPLIHSHHEAVGSPGFDAIVMERLGPTLHDRWVAETAQTAFPGSTILRIGHSALHCLRRLHRQGFVHNDIKPNNLLMGAPSSVREQSLHLIDFGLCTRSDDGGLEGTRGTPLFASVNAHAGRPTSAVDDVESLVYCLAYLAAGTLPWERKTPERAAFLKRKMLTDGCSTLVDSCAADRLTEDVHAAATVDALQGVWLEVVASHETGGDVDYEACLEALKPVGVAHDI